MQEIGYRAPRRSLLDDGSWEVDFYRYDVSTIPAMVLNTNEGRDIYSMDSWQKMPYPVSAIGPGYHSFDTSKDEGPGSKRSVFYTSAQAREPYTGPVVTGQVRPQSRLWIGEYRRWRCLQIWRPCCYRR